MTELLNRLEAETYLKDHLKQSAVKDLQVDLTEEGDTFQITLRGHKSKVTIEQTATCETWLLVSLVELLTQEGYGDSNTQEGFTRCSNLGLNINKLPTLGE